MRSWEEVPLSSQWKDWLAMLILTASVLSIYVPYGLRDPLLFLALVAAYRERHLIRVGVGMKYAALLMVAYILVFTVVSTDVGRSAKGAYDMLRGMLVFFVGYVLAVKLEDPRKFAGFTAIVTVSILLAFLLPQQYEQVYAFYGYHVNPNNTAVALVIYTILAIPMLGNDYRQPAWLVGCVGIIAGMYLLILTNSRGAWLGLFGACLAILFVQPRITVRHRLVISLLLALGFAVLLIFANVKGGSLSLRDQIWLGLLRETADARPWLGFGINRAKDVMTGMGLPTLTAHNLFLEIFISSGIVGLVFMLFVIGRFALYLLSFRYRRTTPFYMGLGGMTAYLLMAQFDLKLSSFIFMATISLFLALLYSQRVPGENC